MVDYIPDSQFYKVEAIVRKTTFWQFYARESGDSYGKAELISLEELKDESKGYLVKDTIVLEAVMLCVSETKLVDSTI
ncbi:hypothetical protein Bca52824_061536 [Brassica carinata]|uniref:MATH domain-containing protein n=1 Tax=Brassica carinata TaxID=52824 RepID=A0A8X7QZI7_BRACI|nr:hypothetical protein Bca52824_061536 [Brassica carinata]